MKKEEIEIVKEFINKFGYYQSFEPVQNWFKWDDVTTENNIKYALREQNIKNNIFK